MKFHYPLTHSSWDKKEFQALNKVISSNFFTMGSNVAAAEKQFGSYFKAKYCVMTSSGSTANLIATAALFFKKKFALKAEDEVIVPAVSWSTTYFPLHQYGLKLKFVDIDIETLNYDLEKLKQAVSGNTRAIVAVNLLGNPNNFDQIQKVIKGKNIYLIEDNCESMGARFEGQFAGTFGDLGTFSTFFSHHISTMEGGFVVTNDEELYHILLSLRAHGWTRNLPEKNLITGKKSTDPFKESYNFVLPGYNVRPLEFSGALAVEQIKKLNLFLKIRRKNASHFQKLFQGQSEFQIQKETGSSSWFGFSLIIKGDSKLKRAAVLKKLSKAKIETRPIVSGNFTKNPVMKYFNYEIHKDLKNADLLDQNGFFVGNNSADLTEKINYLKRTLGLG